MVAFIQAFVRGFEVSPMVNTIPIMMAKSCILWDPLIYLGGNKKFRQALFSDIVNFAQLVKSKCSQLHAKMTAVVEPISISGFDSKTSEHFYNNVAMKASSLAKKRESKSKESCTPTSFKLVLERYNSNELNVLKNNVTFTRKRSMSLY